MSAPTRYRATLAYVGTGFRGWQRQKNAPRTVQSVLEAALSELDGAAVTAHAAGRTDAGVHADGQVCHFDLTRRRDVERIADAANALLPWDVRILDVREAAPAFHARRDAVWKEYVYCWSRARVVGPRDAPFVAPISPRADAARMRAEAQQAAGEHDFAVFSVRGGGNETTVRRIHFVRVELDGDALSAVFRGDAFLRGMVRSLCGVLADVARGKTPPGRMRALLETQDRKLLSPKAPAQGLSLRRVFYGDGEPEE